MDEVEDFSNWVPFGPDDEYDPSEPNDYEAIILERRRLQREAE